MLPSFAAASAQALEPGQGFRALMFEQQPEIPPPTDENSMCHELVKKLFPNHSPIPVVSLLK